MDEGKEIQEGFNAGYILEQYRPQLTKAIIDGVKEGNSPLYWKGLRLGVGSMPKSGERISFWGS